MTERYCLTVLELETKIKVLAGLVPSERWEEDLFCAPPSSLPVASRAFLGWR